MIVKKMLLLSILMCFIILFSACGDVIVEPKWVIGIKGAEVKVFSSIDCDKLDDISIRIERTQSDGSIIEEELQGVYLKDVLDYLDIEEYSSVTLSSRDDVTVNYLSEAVEDITTILATKVNGKEVWEEGYIVIQLVSGNQPEDRWIWNLKTLTVNP